MGTYLVRCATGWAVEGNLSRREKNPVGGVFLHVFVEKTIPAVIMENTIQKAL